ncbi:MAG: ROK family protein [Cyclobacteriaceae bacterium]
MKPLWGIDLGGTKIEGVILENADSAKSLCRMRIPTEQEQGYQHILTQIQKLLHQMPDETGLKPEKVGFGTPGTLAPLLQTLKNSNTTCLNGKAFVKDMEAKLGIPIVIANDANCFALAETRLGIVKEKMPDARVVFGVIMGTGVGGGVVIDGKVWNGRQGIGGEWGHNFLDESGGVAYTGRKGVVETVLAGPSLEDFYQRHTGTKRTLKEIYQRCKTGNDETAQQTIQRLTEFFGLAISVVINILDPDAIVLGGGVGNIDELYMDGVEVVKKYIFNNRLDTQFFRPKLGDSAGVFGAAMLVS